MCELAGLSKKIKQSSKGNPLSFAFGRLKRRDTLFLTYINNIIYYNLFGWLLEKLNAVSKMVK